MEKKYLFETMTVKEMTDAMNAAGKVSDMTLEEEIEDDAEYGYFQMMKKIEKWGTAYENNNRRCQNFCMATDGRYVA